jgi:serine-type D-Ala-D-Ala carboxypeptidase
VVEREAGLPLAEAARELVLGPAGMQDSGFAPGDAVPSAHGDSVERTMIESGDPYPVDEDAAAFAGWRDGVLAGEPNDGNTHHAFGGAAGHAGLFATAPDLARWGAALLTGELSPRERVDRWLAPVHGDRALGFRRYGDRVAGHGGFTGGQVRLAPAEGIVTVLLTNRLLAEGGPPDVEPAATELMELALEGAAHAA